MNEINAMNSFILALSRRKVHFVLKKSATISKLYSEKARPN